MRFNIEFKTENHKTKFKSCFKLTTKQISFKLNIYNICKKTDSKPSLNVNYTLNVKLTKITCFFKFLSQCFDITMIFSLIIDAIRV